MNRAQPSAAVCNGCGATQDRSLIIHNVRYRAYNRRYCTNCVLKSHQGLFCPICFEVYDDSPPPHLRLMCLKCPAIAHRTCVLASPDSAAPAPAFQCPTCADPNFSYFKLSTNDADHNSGAIDVQSAKVLVAAARIAAVSMSKAAAAARFDAERRAKEAAVARKKAREALENLAYIVAREQEDKAALTEQRGVAGQNSGLHVT